MENAILHRHPSLKGRTPESAEQPHTSPTEPVLPHTSGNLKLLQVKLFAHCVRDATLNASSLYQPTIVFSKYRQSADLATHRGVPHMRRIDRDNQADAVVLLQNGELRRIDLIWCRNRWIDSQAFRLKSWI